MFTFIAVAPASSRVYALSLVTMLPTMMNADGKLSIASLSLSSTFGIYAFGTSMTSPVMPHFLSSCLIVSNGSFIPIVGKTKDRSY